jgi:PAS domain S-box-containing protein
VTTYLASQPAAGGDAFPYALYELTLAVAAAKDPADIFDAALSCLEQSLGVGRSSVLLFGADGVLRFKAWRGLSDTYRAAVEGHSPWTPDTTDAAPVLVEDAHADPSLAELRPTLEAEGICALAFVPLAIGTRLLGKFMLYYAEPHAFDERELLTARTIAANAAFAIDQRAHRETEQRYQHLVDSLGVAVYTTDAEGRITFFNDEAVRIWGRRPEIGDVWCGASRLYHADGTHMPHDQCIMAQAVRERRPIRDVEAIVERADGTRVHLVPHPTPIFDDAGKLLGGVNILIDITARKRAEAALVENEARLVSALREKDESIAARDETIRLYEAVQAQLASLVEASGALISAHGSRDAVPAILQIARQLLSADAYAIWKFIEERDHWEIISADGVSERYIAESRLPAGDGQRRLERALVVEDVHAEEGLSALGERYEHEGIRSMFVAPLTVGDDKHGTLAFYYRTPHKFSDLEVRVGVALANLASASLSASQLFAENDQARKALELSNMELARTAAELRVANAAKDEFLSLVSHELKTPLTTIRGNAGILFRSNGNVSDESREAALADIVRESERLHRIIENLLLLARAERGQPLDAEPILVVRVVERLIARHRATFPYRPFEIVEHGDPRPVIFSEASLEQVTENLISNAEKYSAPTSPIVIDFDRGEDEVVMRVLDRGAGVRAEDAEKLFDPFYRSGSVSSRAEGLGIGLAVCKRLVEAQGGRMWAKNRADGGSEFGFALPITGEELPPEE